MLQLSGDILLRVRSGASTKKKGMQRQQQLLCSSLARYIGLQSFDFFITKDLHKNSLMTHFVNNIFNFSLVERLIRVTLARA